VFSLKWTLWGWALATLKNYYRVFRKDSLSLKRGEKNNIETVKLDEEKNKTGKKT